jgi:hypothetical protein
MSDIFIPVRHGDPISESYIVIYGMQLIDRVVPADIFAKTEQGPFGREECCGMNSTCAVKGLLGPPEQIGETIDEGRVELRARLSHWKRRADFNRAYGKLATNATA